MCADRLAAMNDNKFARGGKIKTAGLDIKGGKFGGLFLTPPDGGDGQITTQGITPGMSLQEAQTRCKGALPVEAALHFLVEEAGGVVVLSGIGIGLVGIRHQHAVV